MVIDKNKKSKKIFSAVVVLSLIFSALLLSACSIAGDENAPDGMINIASEDAYYSFYVPTSWKYTEGDNVPSAYYANNDASNVSLMSFSVEYTDYTVDDWWNGFTEDFEEVYSDFELISSEETVLGGVAAVKKVFKGTLAGTEYQFLQVSAMKKEALSAPQIVVFTYTSIPESFESHNEDVSKMIDNFKFN